MLLDGLLGLLEDPTLFNLKLGMIAFTYFEGDALPFKTSHVYRVLVL